MKKIFLAMLLVFFVTGCTIKLSDEQEQAGSDLNDVAADETQVEQKESVGILSSKTNPLKIGSVGIASKYNAVLEDYRDVDVKLVKIYDDVDTIINDYNAKHQDAKVVAEKGYKLVVLDYEVTLINFETESFGSDVKLDLEVTDTNDNSFVVNGVKQIVKSTTLDEKTGVLNNESGTVTVAFEVPQEVSSYLIKLGTNGHSIAYYKV